MMAFSNKVRILVFGHKEFSQLFSSVLSEFSEQAECRIVDAIIGTIDEANTHIDMFAPDLIISAGSNAAYLQAALDVPVLSLPVTESDIISAVSNASKVSDNVHLITFDKYDRLVELLNNTSSVHIQQYNYETADQARQTFDIANIPHDHAVVGASLICGLAVQTGYKSFLIYSKESCRDVLQQAIKIGTKQKHNIHAQAIQRWLYKDSKTPILILDNSTQLLTTNSAAKDEFLLSERNHDEFAGKLGASGFCEVNDGYCRINDKDWWFHRDHLDIANHSFDIYQFHTQIPDFKETQVTKHINSNLVYKSSIMRQIIEKTDLYAQSPSHVLIIGESGTGKEMIARRIHEKSNFSTGNFVAINCAAMPSELFEGELFGYVDGSFTGSRKGGKTGLLAEAETGVLFLDEVGELSLPQQAKLLRVIQEKCFRPIGSHKEQKINLKIIAATNRPLAQQVQEGLFRSDLYYRLNVLSINLPSLRERRKDISPIVLEKLQEMSLGELSEEVLNTIHSQITPYFEAYQWPGNIRELENIIERLLVYCFATEDLQAETVDKLIKQLAPELFTLQAKEKGGALVEHETQLVNQAMIKFNGNKELVAEYLGISQTTLWRRLKTATNKTHRYQ